LLVGKLYEEQSFDDLMPGQGVVGLPRGFRTIAQPLELNCAEKKVQTPISEYFDSGDNLVSLVAPIPVPNNDIKQDAPLNTLFSKLCNVSLKSVAGKYEGTNHTTYKSANAEGDQRISIDIEQTGNQLKLSFQTPNGGQGEGTGVLEGNVVNAIVLKSTAPSCPGSYEGSFEFNDDGSMKWSFKGQDCSGPMEGYGTAKKAKA
jgi:hypothetical protein